ncbi:hypothetical protein EDB81DRAFT_850046 [Dactylonectria macrodidyma]|uniref:Uncharacterized protein n=1 Tax=Dactylonectria macrodidyma TaxID=307937 RepID=A0A9P9FU03_9HYPO|nr:hypothetical protein EDB81DRAFT_850046 [Dactylonectria macrodidyma]
MVATIAPVLISFIVSLASNFRPDNFTLSRPSVAPPKNRVERPRRPRSKSMTSSSWLSTEVVVAIVFGILTMLATMMGLCKEGDYLRCRHARFRKRTSLPMYENHEDHRMVSCPSPSMSPRLRPLNEDDVDLIPHTTYPAYPGAAALATGTGGAAGDGGSTCCARASPGHVPHVTETLAKAPQCPHTAAMFRAHDMSGLFAETDPMLNSQSLVHDTIRLSRMGTRASSSEPLPPRPACCRRSRPHHQRCRGRKSPRVAISAQHPRRSSAFLHENMMENVVKK